MASPDRQIAKSHFHGLTVASFESRMAVEITRLIERHGGTPLVTPALREIPLNDNSAALQFGNRLMTERVDLLILLTGVGTTALFDLLKTRYPWPSLMAALKQTALVARGPQTGCSPQGLRSPTDADGARTEHLGRSDLYAG